MTNPNLTTTEAGQDTVELDRSTLSILDQVLAEKAADEAKFRALQKQQEELDAAEAAMIAEAEAIADLERLNGITPERDLAILRGEPAPTSSIKKRLTVDEFRTAFGESWQLSQFWYSAKFVDKLFQFVAPPKVPTDAVFAFLCCPTAYVGFQHHVQPQMKTWLFEYDSRFSALSKDDFVRYDLNRPTAFPPQIKGTVDVCLVDPPFLNQVTHQNVAKTVAQLLKPNGEGKVVLITGESIADEAGPMYAEGGLQRTDLVVEHFGLANDFGVWSNL